MISFRFLLLFSLFSTLFAHENSNSDSLSNPLPRPLIVDYLDENAVKDSAQILQVIDTQLKELLQTDTQLKESVETPLKTDNHSNGAQEFDRNAVESKEGLVLQCSSWRFAAETNNLSPWKTIPEECKDYVKDYMTGRAYIFDLERVSNEAITYAKSVEMSGDGMDVWIFDVDETLLSNLRYHEDHGYGFELFSPEEFNKWVEKAAAPPIQPSLKLYKEVLGLGFKVFLLTGRSENQRTITIENLIKAGFQNWDKLILRSANDHGKLAVIFKSEKRRDMVNDGYRIVGNSGDQWSDLLGFPMSLRNFKLPNPMYYIP